VFHYKGIRLEVTNVARAILVDDDPDMPLGAMITIQERLYEHMTGKRPINGERWQKRELSKEKKLCR
jgi:hypothetical protein